MKVAVIFEFKNVDVDSEVADEIVREISESCETMQRTFDADACWIDDAVTVKGE